MFVEYRFTLAESTVDELKAMKPEFGYDGFGEFVFYRTYSRTKEDGSMETWNDVVIRVTEGTFSIRKDWYKRNRIPWNEDFWQVYARNFAISMFKMEWLPPGRGLWAMGSQYIYDRGGMALQNCGFARVKNIAEDCHWIMDSLMNGVGVGFSPERDDDIELLMPQGHYDFVIPDTREGWCDSVRELIDCHFTGGLKPIFKYHEIRPSGLPIKGFGGIASGPGPLKQLHERIEEYLQRYMFEESYDSVMLKTDIVNSIGCCVVAGNVRRSAELAAGPLDDPTFLELKNYEKYPYRAAIGWMSNNSVYLEKDEDFERLDEIAQRVIINGEPGFINLRNLPKGRVGKNDGIREDKAVGFNPCGEQPLEDKELCTLAETLPTRCRDSQTWLKACEYATMYASTVSLLPTHRPETNAVMLRNRRIGVGIIDITGWKHIQGVSKVIKWLRKGYEIVTKTNQWVNSEAGVPEAIRKTTVKPGGTVPKVAGKTAGAGYPTFHETLRRIRVAKNSKLHPLLVASNVPFEEDVNDKYTDVFEWPIIQGPSKPAAQVTLWEQAMNLVMLQREWSDNAVSNTLYFRPKWQLTQVNVPSDLHPNSDQKIINGNLYTYNPYHEEDDIEPVLSTIAPLTKSVSLLPHTAEGVYPQSPETGLTPEEYAERRSKIKPIDWTLLTNHTPDIESEKFCTGDRCSI